MSERISQLTTASVLTGAELIPLVQNGANVRESVSGIITSLSNNYGLYSSTGSSTPITGSGTATSFSGSLINGGVGTLSVPANGFQVGDSFRLFVSGKITAANNTTIDIQLKSGNVLLADTGVITLSNTTNKAWTLVTDFTINSIGQAGAASIIGAGTFQYRQDAGSSVNSEIFNDINSTTFNTTISNTLEVLAIWGANANVTNTISSNILTLNKIY